MQIILCLEDYGPDKVNGKAFTEVREDNTDFRLNLEAWTIKMNLENL